MNDIKEKIKAVVIDRTTDTNVFNIIGLNLLQPVFESLGIQADLGDDWETNGWQCDWWWKFNHDGLPFVLSGGLFSHHIQIALDTDKLSDLE